MTPLERQTRQIAARDALRAFYEWARVKGRTDVHNLALEIGRLMPSPPQTPEELARCDELTQVITSLYVSDRSPEGIRDAVLSHIRALRPEG